MRPFQKKWQKYKELKKSPVLTDAPYFANDSVESPHTPGAKVKTTKVGQYYHHYSSKTGPEYDGHHPGFTQHFHSISESPDPDSKPIGSLIGHTTNGHDKFKVDSSHVETSHRGEGHGKALYKMAAKHHGNLHSDTALSGHAHAVYQSISEDPDYHVKMGSTGSHNEHDDENSHSIHYMGKSLQAGDSYNDLRKAEELRKMPVLTDAPEFADDPIQSPHHKGAEIKTTKVGKLYHHYSSRRDPGMDHLHPQYMQHAHSLSQSPDPHAKPIAALVGRTGKDSNTLRMEFSHVDTEHRGMGHGKRIYKLAAKHHGTLESDTTLSSDAHDVYASIAKDKKYKVKMGTTMADDPEDEEDSHHITYVGKSELKPGDTYNDLRKAEDLAKMGAVHRLAPNKHSKFDDSKASPDSVRNAREWMHGDGKNIHEKREAIPAMSHAERFRSLHSLSGKTQTRKNASGEREFLLYRGHPENELGVGRTSWTPHAPVAADFARTVPQEKGIGHVTSAWIPEKHIASVPKHQYLGDSQFHREHEVVVEPHNYRVHESSQWYPFVDKAVTEQMKDNIGMRLSRHKRRLAEIRGKK